MNTRKTFVLIFAMASLASMLSCEKSDDNDDNGDPSSLSDPPAASFTITPASGNTSTVFTLDASASTDDEDNLSELLFRWDFTNNGNWNTPPSSDPIAQYQFAAEGTYTIKLEVTDTDELSGTTTRQVTITDTGNLPPNAPANPQPEDGETGQDLSLTLYWTCSDPNQDQLSYDVYFGTSNPPPAVENGILANSYSTGQLSENTTYYWKIVAFDEADLSTEGPVWEFTTQSGFMCGDPFTDPRNNKTYGTLEVTNSLGTQCWMTANINIGTMIGGTQEMTDNGVIEKYCYDDIENNCDGYGALYQWNELMQYVSTEGAQGICPGGWHVASDLDWGGLEEFIGMPMSQIILTGLRGTDEAKFLKENSPDNIGFDALFNGYRNNGGTFNAIGSYATFATSTQSNLNLAYVRYLFNDHDQILRDKYEKAFGFGVRCVKDN
ncbi:MAG: FISUMP domain-containing protein [Bacteroidales bacterium]